MLQSTKWSNFIEFLFIQIDVRPRLYFYIVEFITVVASTIQNQQLCLLTAAKLRKVRAWGLSLPPSTFREP